MSARICVGWNSFVRPFQTGTEAYCASSSTMLWPKPRYSMPSNIRESTRAVSAMDSFLPICEPEGSRYTGCMPRSAAATSKEQRVRVLVFSKMSATLLPSQSLCGMPAFFLAFSSAARSEQRDDVPRLEVEQLQKILAFEIHSLSLLSGAGGDDDLGRLLYELHGDVERGQQPHLVRGR